MFRIFLLLSLLSIFLQARENPFFPAKGEKDIAYTSNNIKVISPLDYAKITLPSSARLIKRVTIEYENLDASIVTKSIKLNNTIDWHKPIYITQSKTAVKKRFKQVYKNYKKIISNRYVSLFKYAKNLKIITKDKIIRNFLLVKPHRIVLDFKRDTNLKSYKKSYKNAIFKKVKIGNHKGYYRIVIELDGPYMYKTKKSSTGYMITLH